MALSLMTETVLKLDLNPEQVLEGPAVSQAAKALPLPLLSVPSRGCGCYLAEDKHRLGSDTAAMMRSGEGEKRGIAIPTYTDF